MKDGTVTKGPSIEFHKAGDDSILGSGASTFDVEKVTVHAEGRNGLAGNCTIAFASE